MCGSSFAPEPGSGGIPEHSRRALPCDLRIIGGMSGRRGLILSGVIAALVFATGTPSAAAPLPRIGPVSPAVPLLRNAFAFGMLVRLDSAAAVGELKISCGWYYTPRRKLRAGLWKVRLRGLTFGWESNPAHPGRGSVATVSLRTWERRVRVDGWSGSVRLRRGGGSLSNGPTTDICTGSPG